MSGSCLACGGGAWETAQSVGACVLCDALERACELCRAVREAAKKGELKVPGRRLLPEARRARLLRRRALRCPLCETRRSTCRLSRPVRVCVGCLERSLSPLPPSRACVGCGSSVLGVTLCGACEALVRGWTPAEAAVG